MVALLGSDPARRDPDGIRLPLLTQFPIFDPNAPTSVTEEATPSRRNRLGLGHVRRQSQMPAGCVRFPLDPAAALKITF